MKTDFQSYLAVHLTDHITFNMNTRVAIHVDSIITAEVMVYTYVYGDQQTGFKLDTMDTEITWLLNGKPAKSQGFRELYTQLHGKEQLNALIEDVCTEAENLTEGRVATSFPDLVNDAIL